MNPRVKKVLKMGLVALLTESVYQFLKWMLFDSKHQHDESDPHGPY
jgi:hypothetical protein